MVTAERKNGAETSDRVTTEKPQKQDRGPPWPPGPTHPGLNTAAEPPAWTAWLSLIPRKHETDPAEEQFTQQRACTWSKMSGSQKNSLG